MSTHPAQEAFLQRVPIESVLPSLAALFHETVDIAGTGKRSRIMSGVRLSRVLAAGEQHATGVRPGKEKATLTLTAKPAPTTLTVEEKEQRKRKLETSKAERAERKAAFEEAQAGGGSSSQSAWLPADLSAAPLKDVQSNIAKTQVEIEDFKKRGQVDTPPYRDAVKLLLALREEAKRRLKEKQQAEKEERRKTAEAELFKRRDLALANPDHYERYLTSARDRAWWKNEGRLRAEAAREAREEPPRQDAKTSWATPDWRPPSNVKTEEI